MFNFTFLYEYCECLFIYNLSIFFKKYAQFRLVILFAIENDICENRNVLQIKFFKKTRSSSFNSLFSNSKSICETTVPAAVRRLLQQLLQEQLGLGPAAWLERLVGWRWRWRRLRLVRGLLRVVLVLVLVAQALGHLDEENEGAN